jgi:hypothetical protein
MATRISTLGALGFSLIAGCGATNDDIEPGGEATAYVQVGGDTYRVIDLGLDRESYRELSASFGSVSNVTDLGPSTSGHRELRIHVDAHAPSAVFDFLLSSWNAAPVPGTASHHTSFGVLLGGGGTQAVGLLLPAVQKFGGVAIEEDGSMAIAIAGDGTIQSIDGGVPQATGGVQVAAGDVTGDISGARAGQLLISPLIDAPYFKGTDDGMESTAIVVARPDTGLPSWLDAETPVAVAIDIREPGGAVLHRFRMASALPDPADDRDITLKPAKAIYMKVNDIEGETTDDSEEAALVATSYAAFSSRTYVAARGALQSFVAIDASGGTPTYDELVAYWATERDSTVAALHAAVAHAADLEGLVCQTAVPATATLATVLGTMPLTADSASALATVYEATQALPSPLAGAYAGGPLAMSALAAASDTAPDAAPACRALAALAPFADGLIASGSVDPNKAGYLNQAAALAPSPRVLDAELVAWVELVDAIVAGTVTDNATARAAAKAKADILIESLSEHEQASSSRYDLAHLLVGL